MKNHLIWFSLFALFFFLLSSFFLPLSLLIVFRSPNTSRVLGNFREREDKRWQNEGNNFQGEGGGRKERRGRGETKEKENNLTKEGRQLKRGGDLWFNQCCDGWRPF
jgi:hypothetical protein